MNVRENVLRERVRELGADRNAFCGDGQWKQEEHEIEECGNGRTALIEASEKRRA